jgi:hypothetical protein
VVLSENRKQVSFPEFLIACAGLSLLCLGGPDTSDVVEVSCFSDEIIFEDKEV